jgi:hypothetical protein
MALSIIDIENALYAWVAGASGIVTIFSNQGKPRPVDPYALINIVQNTPVGIAEHRSELLIDDSIDRTYSNVEEVMVSINTYFANAYQNATLIKDSLARVTVTDQLYNAGLGYISATTVQDVPEIIDLTYEERAQFDCTFYVRSTDNENIETIQQIELTNLIDDYETTIVKP